MNSSKFYIRLFCNLVVHVLFAITLFSQEWASTGTKWIYSAFSTMPSQQDYSYLLHESVKDTIINSQLMHQIDFKRFVDGSPTELIRSEVMYMENNRIYLYKWNRANLLYDFNLHVGESYTLQMPDNSTQSSEFTMTYNSIWNMNNKDYRMMLYESNDELYFGDVIMENVGSMHFFFPTNQAFFPPEYDRLRCFITSDTLYYYDEFSYDFCEYFRTAYISELETSDLKFYPNPISNLSTVFIPEEFGNIASIKILGINGQELSTYNLQNRNITLNKENFNAGIYFIEVETSKQKFRGKFVLD